MTKEELESICSLKLSNNPLKISENIIFLGEIPQSNNFEKREIIGECDLSGKMVEDTVRDDTLWYIKVKEGYL